jgi:hypothetical protein
MIPNTPLAGTGDPNPLLTVGQYQTITTDTASTSAAITAAITDALDFVQHRCNRTLLYGQYEETLYIYRKGFVYPSAVPLDQAKSVTVAGVSGTAIPQGNGMWIGFFTPLPTLPIWTGVIDPQTKVDYWGGYTQTSLPVLARRLIARVAYYALNPFVNPGMPSLARSVNVGGISVSGDLSQMVLGDPQLRRDLERFTRRTAHAWQW